jgi:DNA-binding LacI/PurR family transcriptional regulator
MSNPGLTSPDGNDAVSRRPYDTGGRVARKLSSYRARLAAMHVPVVIVDPVGQPDPRIPSIGATNWAGGLMATEHLIEIGHRRIETITGRPSLLCSQARLDGHRAALERAGGRRPGRDGACPRPQGPVQLIAPERCLHRISTRLPPALHTRRRP